MTLKSHAKFEEKLTSGLENNLKNLANFHQNICKNWYFHGILLFKGENFTEELYVMTLKNDENSEEELTCHFKIDFRNSTNFDSKT